MTKPNGERFRLTLRDLPDDLPVAIRLRHVLKCLLRAWAFRCERVEEMAAANENQAPTAKANSVHTDQAEHLPER